MVENCHVKQKYGKNAAELEDYFGDNDYVFLTKI